jgi:HlyD family secretion protein
MNQQNVAIESARAALKQAQDNLVRQQSLWKQGLTTRESLESAENTLRMRQADLNSQEKQIETQKLRMQQEAAQLENAKYNLSKVRIESPIDGIITRRNIEEGETVVVGTMNNAGTVLLTVADMSIIEAEVEVDETDIPLVRLGQPARITIDAIPDREFSGKVTEIGNSPIQVVGGGTTRTATNFKVTVTIDGQIPEVRPGFTCTAEITTATRKQAISVPIQAMTVRELLYDEQGNVVHETRPPRQGFSFRFGPPQAPQAPAAPLELKPGQKREEKEGVFTMKDGKAAFIIVKTGIAGERYLEVLAGLKDGDSVITGPFDSVRGMFEGDLVKVAPKPGASAAPR